MNANKYGRGRFKYGGGECGCEVRATRACRRPVGAAFGRFCYAPNGPSVGARRQRRGFELWHWPCPFLAPLAFRLGPVCWLYVACNRSILDRFMQFKIDSRLYRYLYLVSRVPVHRDSPSLHYRS